MKTINLLILTLVFAASSFGAEKKQSTADHLQNISVTIRAEGQWSAGEGSGVIFTRKDSEGNLVGVSVLENNNNVVVVWGNDSSLNSKDGMLDGEIFSIELWEESSNKTFTIEFEWQEGVDYFNTNGINWVYRSIVN
jgi:hypothetical protein